MKHGVSWVITWVVVSLSVSIGAVGTPQTSTGESESSSSQQALVNRYCVGCHNERLRTGNLALDTVPVSSVGQHPEIWEKVVRKLRGGVMPPVGRPRPSQEEYESFSTWLETELDRVARLNPNPGRTETLHRLNRAEYRNSIRDLLAVELDIVDYLPADNASYGFDNIAGVLRMSQSLMERYLLAARSISRIAVGSPPPAVDATEYRPATDMPQQEQMEGLPFGTRGGLLARHLFPQDAEYDFRVEVAGGRAARGLELFEITVDGVQVALFELGEAEVEGVSTTNTTAVMYAQDGAYNIRVPVESGPREVGVSFYKKPTGLVEQVREVFDNPRIMGNAGLGGTMPTITSLTVRGPYEAAGSGSTPSRDQIFVCQPLSPAEEGPCARTIKSTLARRAYRGPVTGEDLEVLVAFYERARADGRSFDGGIEMALRRLLVSPEFLYRIEGEPETNESEYHVTDLDLASRLSFFIWSSIPDDELLELAEDGRLSDPAELDRQVRRMLLDPKSKELTKNFAGQWLQLRNLETVVRPGDPYALAFDEALRQGLLRETELFIDSVVRENRSLVEILTADYTFLNERVARHYDIPNVQGSHFRRVQLPADNPRRGLLGHGSVLTITSHAIRTSPVNRGKWILDNVLGTPPPDPPPNIPALDDKKTQAKLASLRDRMSAHRANPVCASCHNVIDPAGFALENFDAIGRWRKVDRSFNVIDASGALPDGTPFDGVTELTQALVRRPERFVNTVAGKLLTYALGRGIEYYDMPSLRKIVADAASHEYRFHSIVLGIVKSYPFLYRSTTIPDRVEASIHRPIG